MVQGPDPRQSLIPVFEHIRDIPYSLAVPITGPAFAPERILNLGKGSCRDRNITWWREYRRLGFDVVYATFPFLWQTRISNPPELSGSAMALPFPATLPYGYRETLAARGCHVGTAPETGGISC